MASATTTWDAVRRQMVTTIKALTPSSLSSHTYRATRTAQHDFRTHATANPSRIFREYEIEMLSDLPDGTQNYQVEMRVVEAELVMAYPHHWATFATKEQTNTWQERSLRALANEDRNLLDKAIGIRGSANYVAAQRVCEVGAVEFEERDRVTVMVLPLTVMYMQDSS